MNWLLKNNILRILDETQEKRNILNNHPLYKYIKTKDDIHIFMENHVFAVWDFMSVLKSLQNKLTCTKIPWIPKKNSHLARLINEIVLGEESDINQFGQYLSHFEMYYYSMKEAGANTNTIDKFLIELKSNDTFNALDICNAPNAASKFVKETFNSITDAPPHILATIFTLGREEIIPEMFRKIVADINEFPNGNLKSFLYYLDRHIGLDEDEHGPAALKMVKELCGKDEKKWKESIECGKTIMDSRITFWDNILDQINKK